MDQETPHPPGHMDNPVVIRLDRPSAAWGNAAYEAELRAELESIYAVVDHSSAALYDAVKKSKKRMTGKA